MLDKNACKGALLPSPRNTPWAHPSSRRGVARATRTLHSISRREVEHRLAMALERLPGEDLCEEVSRVGIGRHVLHSDGAGAAKLPHLEKLPVDVAVECCPDENLWQRS